MQQEQGDRFKATAKLVKKLVQSYAQEMGVTIYSVALEDGRLAGCRDSHLLSLFSEGFSVSALLPQSELENGLDSDSDEQIKERIAGAVRRLVCS